MNNQEILTKVIEKAIANGWEPLGDFSAQMKIEQWQGEQMVELFVMNDQGFGLRWTRELEGVIFNHDFAKALWGEDVTALSDPDPSWVYHLQRMVISDNPIEYLRQGLPDSMATDSDAQPASEPESQEGDTGGLTR